MFSIITYTLSNLSFNMYGDIVLQTIKFKYFFTKAPLSQKQSINFNSYCKHAMINLIALKEIKLSYKHLQIMHYLG